MTFYIPNTIKDDLLYRNSSCTESKSQLEE